MPYIHFTEEQKRQANRVNLAEFLRFKGEPLIRSGRELRMERNHSVTVSTIKKLCDGLDITLRDFFNVPAFDDLEQEIK